MRVGMLRDVTHAPIVVLSRRIAAIDVALRNEKERHSRRMEGLTDELAEAKRHRELAAASTLTPDEIQQAETIIDAMGWHRMSESVVGDALADLAAGAPKLRSIYFGVKDYAGFSGQRTDCKYNCGPRHGHIVFRIGLTKEAREKTDAGELSVADLELASRYVLACKAVQGSA